MQTSEEPSLDLLCINTLRTLSIDAVQKANSGHPGLPLGAAPMAYVLFDRYLRHNPSNPKWYNRDRFVLSAGHGSMLLYSLLHLTGYPLPLEQIKQFRQLGSITPGHPESELTPGVEVTTGPLGQGFGNGIGMAIAEAYLSARYNREGFPIIDHHIYGIVSDGDIMEGVSAEAASLAGHFKLGNLIYLYDSNHITLSSSTQVCCTEHVGARFSALGWQTQEVEDGNDLEAIDRALDAARKEKERPSLIIVRTHIGYGSPHKQDTYEVHGSPLGEEEVKLTKEKLGWLADTPFYIPKIAEGHFRLALERGKRAEKTWCALFEKYAETYPKEAAELKILMSGKLPDKWEEGIPSFSPDLKEMSTRAAGGKVMQMLISKLPGLIGGSGDLNPSTFTELKDAGTFGNPSTALGDLQGSSKGGWSYEGRNIFYGVREHAMGAISNGIATYPGLIPYAATFLVFSDYMRPAIRLAALMRLHVIYVFTHDSIGLGEDGPTHQPVEQLCSLRAIPNLTVIRPADANETAVAWKAAVESFHSPTALILSRQNLPIIDQHKYASAEGLQRGAYILSEAHGSHPDVLLIASGSEVSLILDAQRRLYEENIAVRCISMPSWELFDAQPQEYRDTIFPSSCTARLAVEAGVAQGWEKYVGDQGAVISVEQFGASAPGKTLMHEYGFTVEHVCQQVRTLL